MRIGLISTSIFPSPVAMYGGTEQVVYDLAYCLGKKHDVTVFAPKGSKIENCNVVETVDPAPPGQPLAPYFQNEQIVARMIKYRLAEFDIVNDHSHLKLSYVMHYENPVFDVCSTISTLDPLSWRTLPPVDHANMIAISKQLAQEITKKHKTPVKYIYNGLDFEKFPLYKEKGNRLLFLSRITPYKGAHTALELAKRVNMPIDIAGDDKGPGEFQYVMQLKEQCKGLNRFWGSVIPEVRLYLMQRAKALVLPIEWPEPFGLVIIEANACGTPVIVTPNGAFPELIKDGVNGYLCKTGDEMIAAVKKINAGIIDPARCRAYAKERFSRELMAERYEEAYKEILAGREW